MRTLPALCLALLLAGCASFDGRGLMPGSSSAAEVESVMGAPAEKRQVANGETWYFYPRQPYGRMTFVARIAPDGRLIALEQRLTEEYVGKLVRDRSRSDDVLALFGRPYERMSSARMDRETWTWHMRRYTNRAAGLHVQLSPDGVVREYYMIDEDDKGDRTRN